MRRNDRGCNVPLDLLWAIFYVHGDSQDTMGGPFDSELVDGVKQVIRILPVNAFQVVFWMCQNQGGNNQSIIQQTDMRLGSGPDASQMPGPSVQAFNPVGCMIFVALTEKVIYPMYTKYVGKPPSLYGKLLAGYCVVTVAMIWTGCFEVFRRNSGPLTYVDADGETQFILNDDGGQVMNDIPWWTGIPQYLLVALAEVLTAVSAYDINYSEVPQSMRSTSIALAFFASSIGNTLMSIMVLLFGKYIPANLNDGHIEYIHFTLGGIMTVTIFLYVVVMNKMQIGMIPPVGKDNEEKAGRSAV